MVPFPLLLSHLISPLSLSFPLFAARPPTTITAHHPLYLSLSLTAVTLAATWGIKWYYEERLLAELNCITRTGNIPWECVREWSRGWRVEGRGVLVGARERQSRRERERKKGGLKWIVNSNALITVKALDKEHPRTPTEHTLGATKGHLALSDSPSTSVYLLLSLSLTVYRGRSLPNNTFHNTWERKEGREGERGMEESERKNK